MYYKLQKSLNLLTIPVCYSNMTLKKYIFTCTNKDRGCKNEGWSHKARAAVSSRSRKVDGRRPEVHEKNVRIGASQLGPHCQQQELPRAYLSDEYLAFSFGQSKIIAGSSIKFVRLKLAYLLKITRIEAHIKESYMQSFGSGSDFGARIHNTADF